MYLVTGGCGFVGKHLVKELIRLGKSVRILDSLSPQVHGKSPDLRWLNQSGIEFIHGSVCDNDVCSKALKGVDTVFHLAAETGTGQSMYEMRLYADTNVTGTAAILEECLRSGVHTFVLSSSRAVYGEGIWRCPDCGPVNPAIRKTRKTAPGWNPLCPSCDLETEKLLPTTEIGRISPVSIYGATKVAQEQLSLLASETGKISCRVLRFFNVYGPGQALSNPYTGVLGVFVNRARQGKRLDLYEDGLIERDFVNVADVVNALIKASQAEFDGAINIGSGQSQTIMDLARKIIELSESSSTTSVTGKGRLGDVRGLVADISRAREILGWEPKIGIDEGLKEYVGWALMQEYEDKYEQSLEELKQKGLYT